MRGNDLDTHIHHCVCPAPAATEHGTNLHGLVVANRHEERVDAVIGAAADQVGKHDAEVGVYGAIRDPVFLSLDRVAVDDEFVLGLVEERGRLHLHGIIAVAQFSQPETADAFQCVDVFQERVEMFIGAQFQNRSPEQIELHRHFGGHRRVDNRRQLVGGEYLPGIVLEIENRYVATVTDQLQSFQSDLSFFL